MNTIERKDSEEKLLFIPSPAGLLETAIKLPSQLSHSIACIICHPHPLYGGTMHNKVITTLARTFYDLGLVTIRFNYRGVGKSTGTYGHGNGETEDTLTLIEWAKKEWPSHQLWLAGFSFGAYVSLRAAIQTSFIQQLISIAPAVNHADFTDLHPHCPWILIQGDQDEIVPAPEVYAWAKQLQPPPDIISFPNASHFFHGELVNLRQQLSEKLKHAHTL